MLLLDISQGMYYLYFMKLTNTPAKIKATRTIHGDYLYRDILIQAHSRYARQAGGWNQYFVIYKEKDVFVKKIEANNLSHAKDIINGLIDEPDAWRDFYLNKR